GLNSGWKILPFTPPLTLSRGNYTCVLKDTSKPNPQDGYYNWFKWNDSESGDNGTVYIKTIAIGAWSDPKTTDLPLRLKILPLNPNNISEPLEYSTADQVNMKANSEVFGGDNSVSFSSLGVFVFTTNTSVVFQKNWTATFVRGSISVSSSYKVNTTTCVWNLTYNLESVTGGSATTYSGRGVNITSIPSSWSVDSANPGNAIKYVNTIVVSLSDNDAYTNAFVICNSPNRIQSLEVPSNVIMGNSFTVNTTLSTSLSGTVNVSIYDVETETLRLSNENSSTPAKSLYSVNFTIPLDFPVGDYRVVAVFQDSEIAPTELGFYTTTFEISPKTVANIEFEKGEYSATYGEKVSILFRFHYGETDLRADNIMLNGTIPQWSYAENGWHNITYNTAFLDIGDCVLIIQVYNSEYTALGQVILHVSEISQKGFVDQLLDNLIYIGFLILGIFGAIAFKQLYYAQKQEFFDRQNVSRIMVFWESFALYDQIASEAIGNGKIVDKELVSGLFTAIKDITIEVAGVTLDFRKVYPDHPYYFVYTGTFYCILILKEKPSSRLEEKLLEFAKIVKEKYGKLFEKEYRGLYSHGFGIPEMRLDLDDEVMQIFGITSFTTLELMQIFGIIPPTELQDIVTVPLSYEEIEELKWRDDVKTVLMIGRQLTDHLGNFPLEKLVQEATEALNDIRIAHSATLEALEARLITVAEKAVIP
ncbi:MAG: hypothetical protein ACFE95_20540, partial [Candidatus Hodarchaeota archaeon]